MLNNSEIEITEQWGNDISSPLVSICCITYNHFKYIEQALDSLLMQETKFPFEILIHDDASTDGTTDIIRSYADKFPNIIKPIIQSENQYSQIPIIAPRFLYPIANGQFIALCEGDDYWSDKNKLQKQVNFLEKNTEYSMCAHAVDVVNDTVLKESFYPTVNWTKEKNNFLDILHNHFIPTPSLLFRNDLSDFPYKGRVLKNLRAGDMAIELFMANKGYCYYDPTIMAAYRNHDDGVTKKQTSHIKAVKHYNALYNTINKFSKFKYNTEIKKVLTDKNTNYLMDYVLRKQYKKAFPLFFTVDLRSKINVLKWRYETTRRKFNL